ncbi:MAG: hypothetical protein ACO2PN_03985 [Pyrobaculum sp.]
MPQLKKPYKKTPLGSHTTSSTAPHPRSLDVDIVTRNNPPHA